MTALAAIFAPKSIAVVGASENPEKLGHILLKNLLDSGFAGEVYPVGAGTAPEVLGRRLLPAVREVPRGVDLALVTVANESAAAALKEAAAIGPKAILLLSSGYGEGPLAVKAVAKEVAAIKAQGITRVLGPNGSGVYDAHAALNASYFGDIPRARGNISFLCQSAAYGSLLLHEVRQRGLGLSKFASIGTPLDLDHADFLEYLGRDERTDVIAIVLESLKDGGRFLRAVAEVSLKKPVVVLKAGHSATGPLVHEIDIFRSAARQSGLLLVNDTERFFDTLAALSALSRTLPDSENVCLLAVSGGPVEPAADLCAEIGLAVPRTEPPVRKIVQPLLPEHGSAANPIELTPQIDPARIAPALEPLFADRRFSGFILLDAGYDRDEFARVVADARRRFAKPVVAFVAGAPRATQMFVQAGIPVFPTPERAVHAYHGLVIYRKLLETLKRKGILAAAPVVPATPVEKARVKALKPVVLSEHDAKSLLATVGVPVPQEVVVNRLKEADDFVRKAGYPLVLKINSNKIANRSEVGGVVLNIPQRKALEKSFDDLRKQFKKEPILVQKQVSGVLELIVGARRDPVFGPVVCFGIGGVLTDLLRDFSVRLCPVRRTDAESMIQEIKGAPLLNGYHNIPAVDPPRLIDVLVRVSELMMTRPDVLSLEIDPLIITAEGPVVANARAEVLQ